MNMSGFPRGFARGVTELALKPFLAHIGYRWSRNSMRGSALPASNYYEDETPFSAMLGLHKQFLHDSGWLESKNVNASMRRGEFIPWITYSALHALERLDFRSLRVLEFGAGASSFFFLERCRKLTSYEFDETYHCAIKGIFHSPHVLRGLQDFARVPTECEGERDIVFAQSIQMDLLSDPTLESVDFDVLRGLALQDIQRADLVLVDGGPRNYASQLIAESDTRPIVIVDNADSVSCAMATRLLTNAGYVEIPFRGLGPLNPYQWTTSLFVTSLAQLQSIFAATSIDV
jgi:hypothetical protein